MDIKQGIRPETRKASPGVVQSPPGRNEFVIIKAHEARETLGDTNQETGMTSLWRTLHNFRHGTCLGYGHEVNDKVTQMIVATIITNAQDLRVNQGIREYNILEVGSSPQPTLSLIISIMFETMSEEMAILRPKVTVTALDVAPSHVDMDSLHEAGVEYVVGDVHDLQFKEPTFRAVVMSTVLEYLEDREKALRNVQQSMHPNSLLILFLHANGTKTPDFLRKLADDEMIGFTAINDWREGRISLRDALTILKQTRLHEVFGFSSPHAILSDYVDNPERHKAVKQMLANNVSGKHRELADHIERGSFKTIEEVEDIITQCGFELVSGYQLQGWKDGQIFWLVSARRI